MTNKDRLLRSGQAAKILGVRTFTVARWADEGKLPCTLKDSGQRLFAFDDVLALLLTYADKPRVVVATIAEIVARGYRIVIEPNESFSVVLYRRADPLGSDPAVLTHAESPEAAVLAAWAELHR